jgi:5-formaminoimidazole-4-carboxamide-1-(beta)-D-ribofuranosyl 5'-monophosphate synthetase
MYDPVYRELFLRAPIYMEGTITVRNMASRNHTIATLGSHCALQLLKGAKDEGLRTLLVCEKKRIDLYKRFRFIDDIFIIEDTNEITSKRCIDYLKETNSILIPHGTLIAYMDSDHIERIDVPIFGNKWILRWEADRELKQKLMERSNLLVSKSVKSKNDIQGLCIVKLHGAAGGRGYFIAWNRESFERHAMRLIGEGMIGSEQDLFIQEYVFGVPAFLHYFYSPITGEIELMGVDRRYESNVDGLGRIPSREQLCADIEMSYNVVGNMPMVLRESLLLKAYQMGESFVNTSKILAPPGMNGPFCLEGVYDKDGNFVSFEFSARIVAGTNLYPSGSPYSDLIYAEPMSMGRRIAREIKTANEKDMIDRVTT